MINTDIAVKPDDLAGKLERFWALSGRKIDLIADTFDAALGAPVFTVEGKYTARGWTEWTHGFQFGAGFLQFDATGDEKYLAMARRSTVEHMAQHVTHFGVHDHGFNNVSTYGNQLRLMGEGKIPENEWERNFAELAIKCSGAVQARRWTRLPDGGYIYSFNGPHSLFADTIRSLRALALSWKLGHTLKGENDVSISLFERLVEHARATARYNIYYGEGRDSYDVRGRVVHESIFNLNDGSYRCPSSQQGYSPFTTWTRGLAWVMLGYPEELEFMATLDDAAFEPVGGRAAVEKLMLDAAMAACDFYIENTPADGVPYWDYGAPGLAALGDCMDRPAEPYNAHEPVDSSSAAIGAQGLLRLGSYLASKPGLGIDGSKYTRAGLVAFGSLLDEPYLSMDASHQGLILHSVYHRPNGWDHIPEGRSVPCGESSMWGDYHARETALYVQRMIDGKYHAFYNGIG